MPTDSSRFDADQLRRREHQRDAIGFWIRALRLDAGLTQEQLANASGLDRTTIVHLEAGRRSLLIDRMMDLAPALKVTVAEFFEAVERDLGIEPRSRTPLSATAMTVPVRDGSR